MSKVLVLGALGSGMSSLGWMLYDKGFSVHGFDIKAENNKDFLPYRSLTSSETDLQDYDLCSFSSALKDSSLIKKIKAKKTQHRFETVLDCLQGKTLILVGGSHGKSTVTGLIAHCLTVLDAEPSFYIGANFVNTGRGGRFASSSDFAVVESDESDGSILRAIPEYLVMTNIDKEHMPFWRSLSSLALGFYSVGLVTKKKVFIGSWDFPSEIYSLPNLNKTESEQFKLKTLRISEEGTYFTFNFYDKTHEGYIKFWGRVYATNAILCFNVLRHLGFASDKILEAIAKYPGLTKRQEAFQRGSSSVILDYAHHPEEIKEMVQTFASLYGNDIIIFYQPFRKSRILTTLARHRNLFRSYNAYCLEIQDDSKVDNRLSTRFAKITGANFCDNFEETLEEALLKGSKIIIMGAGNIYDRAKQTLGRFN